MTDIVEEYPHSCRIVREHIDGEEDRFHYEGPLGRVKSFYSLDKARLYADVHTVTGGFREEKTGERGVPPAVARAREDIVMAYLAGNDHITDVHIDGKSASRAGIDNGLGLKAFKQDGGSHSCIDLTNP